MLLTQTMNQSQDNGLSQGSYLERLLQEQYQQKVQQQFPNERNRNDSFNNNANFNVSPIENIGIGRQSGTTLLSSGNDNLSSGMTFSSNTGIGINHHQQNQMMNFLQERQQQQQFMTNNGAIGPSDVPSNLGISGLSSNVGLESRIGNNGIGSGNSSSSWMDGINGGINGSSIGNGILGNSGTPLFSTEQDLLFSSQRSPSLGGSVGGSRLQLSGESNGSFSDTPLTSMLGGLPQFCLPSTQTSFSANQKSNRKSLSNILLANQAQAAFFQAAQAQLPRTIRLPCGARGMKADHNSSVSIYEC